ncbi:uncharacterized protein [Coffea arabica]|uniref:Uncharacterized protein n=1 Tax=Coffea arabica TaxID=13443 RepID=A0ABM4UYP8_COFAR
MLWVELLLDRPSGFPWCLAGDFNVIVNEEEKRGGLPFRLSEGLEFLQFMMEARVSDAGFSVSNYTWCNNRQGRAQHLARDPSNHAPLLMTTSTRLDNKSKPFRFLNVWTTKAGLLDVIRDSWSCPVSRQPLCVSEAKLRTIKQVLKGWSKESFGNIFRAVKEAERAMLEAEVAQEQDSSDPILHYLNEARKRLRSTLAIEEGFW